MRTLTELIQTDIPPVEWIIDNILPAGLTMIAGRPKSGKSFLTLNLAIAVASGDKFLDRYQCHEKRVLYISNEDSENRLKERATKMLHEEILTDNLILYTDPLIVNEPDDNEKLLKIINDYNIDVVIIDTYAKAIIYPNSNDNIYMKEYNVLQVFASLANLGGVSIIIVHHTRKAESENEFDNVLGSTALVGAMDTIWIMKKGIVVNQILITGRDVEESSFNISFNNENYTWEISENQFTPVYTPEQGDILSLLALETKEWKTSEIATKIGKSKSTTSFLLKKLLQKDLIENPRYGYYIIKSIETTESNENDNNH